MMFGVVVKVIESKLEKNWFLGISGQKAWTNTLGFWSKFQIC